MPKRKARARRKPPKPKGQPRKAVKRPKTAKRAPSKTRKPSPKRRPQPKPVGQAAAPGWSVSLEWAPAAVRVVINFIGANGQQVAQDDVRNQSAARFSLPPPDAARQYTFTWSISPDQHVDAIFLWAVNDATANRTLVERSGPKEPADVWSQYEGKTINAP